MWNDVKFEHQKTQKPAGIGIKFLILMIISLGFALLVYQKVGSLFPDVMAHVLKQIGAPTLGVGVNPGTDFIIGFLISWFFGAIPSLVYCLATFREAKEGD